MYEISCPHPARPWTVPVERHALYIGPWYVLGVLYPLFLMFCFLCLMLTEGVAFGGLCISHLALLCISSRCSNHHVKRRPSRFSSPAPQVQVPSCVKWLHNVCVNRRLWRSCSMPSLRCLALSRTSGIFRRGTCSPIRPGLRC